MAEELTRAKLRALAEALQPRAWVLVNLDAGTLNGVTFDLGNLRRRNASRSTERLRSNLALDGSTID